MTLEHPRHIAHGEIITDPGCYSMPIGWYHAPCADGPSISNSGLKRLWDDSPAHYWANSYLNPNRLPDEDKPQFAIGRAAHRLLLEGRDGFENEFAIRPDQWTDWRSKDARMWREAALAEGKTVITLDDLAAIQGMAASLAAHPLIRAGILDGYVERSLVWRDKATGVWLKSRPDCIPNASADYADLKSTTSVKTDDLRRTIGAFSYHMQAGLTAMASREVLGRDLQSFSLVFTEKAPPFCVRVVTLKPADIELGMSQVRAAIDLFAECWESGQWPGPGGVQEDAEFIELPDWTRRQAEDRLALRQQMATAA